MTGKDFFEGFNPYNTSLVVQVQKDVASRRVLQLRSNSSLLFLRKEINREFELNDRDFEMYIYGSKMTATHEMDEDYSIVAIENVRIPDQPDVIITPLKDKNPNTQLA